MRNRVLGAAMLVGMAVLSGAVAAQVGPEAWSNAPAAAVPHVTHRTFRSAAVGEDVGYSIFLPPGYEQSTRRYPVVYYLHGAGGNENGGGRSVVPMLVDAFAAGTLPPFIVVFPNGGESTWYADSYDRKIPVETTIIRELIPHVDATYRTQADRAGRAISGMSMGGFGAITLAMKHPELFSSVVAYAPAFIEVQRGPDGSVTLGRPGGTHGDGNALTAAQWVRNAAMYEQMFHNDPAVFAAHSPWTLVSRDATSLRETLPIRFVIGTADGLLNANELFHGLLLQNRYYHDYVVLTGIGHNFGDLYEAVGMDSFAYQARHGGWQ
jgi:S-formylglutathione hydrolase FrmB